MKKILFIAFIGSITPIFAQKTYKTGLNFDDAKYALTPVQKKTLQRSFQSLPAKVDLKPYCPTPQSQGEKSTCVGWALGYAACTIMEAVALNKPDKNQLSEIATSPDFIYAFGKPPTDNDCEAAIGIDATLNKIMGTTIPRQRHFQPLCTRDNTLKSAQEGVVIKAHTRLFQNEDSWSVKINGVKKALDSQKPIVVGIQCYPSFKALQTVWNGNTVNFMGGHAVCIVGYDDNYKGGAVEVMNSWGTEWGQNGFGWILYTDLQKILKYAYELTIELPSKKGNSVVTAKNPNQNIAIQLKFIDNKIMPIELNTQGQRGLKPVKVENETTQQTPSVSTVSNDPNKGVELLAHYKTVESYPSGTRYRVFLDMSQPIYLYVLGSDLTGKAAALFPPEKGISPYLSHKNTAIALPDEQYFIEMDDTKGKDFMLFLFSAAPLSIDEIMGAVNSREGTFLEKMTLNLGSKWQWLAATPVIDKEIKLALPFGNSKIHALCLEIAHH